MSDPFMNIGRASRLLPQAVVDASEAALRVTPYGDQYSVIIMPTQHALTDEGSYFVATNPTPGTPVAYGSAGTATAYADTEAFMVFKNNSSPMNPVQMYLHYIRMMVGGTVPASAVGTRFSIEIDQNRTPTGNSSLITPMPLKFGSTRMPNGQLWVPNANKITVPASTPAKKLVSMGILRAGISVVYDEYEIRFGSVDGVAAQVGTAAGRFVSAAPPIVLGPQEFAVVKLWQPSGATNPLSVEFECGFSER